MGLFDGKPLTREEIIERQLVSSHGATIRKISGKGKVYTARHKPWWMLLGKGPDNKTCGDCAFLLGRGYLKCGRQVSTRGPGTDIRKKDPACRLFRVRTGEVPRDTQTAGAGDTVHESPITP